MGQRAGGLNTRSGLLGQGPAAARRLRPALGARPLRAGRERQAGATGASGRAGRGGGGRSARACSIQQNIVAPLQNMHNVQHGKHATRPQDATRPKCDANKHERSRARSALGGRGCRDTRARGARTNNRSRGNNLARFLCGMAKKWHEQQASNARAHTPKQDRHVRPRRRHQKTCSHAFFARKH